MCCMRVHHSCSGSLHVPSIPSTLVALSSLISLNPRSWISFLLYELLLLLLLLLLLDTRGYMQVEATAEVVDRAWLLWLVPFHPFALLFLHHPLPSTPTKKTLSTYPRPLKDPRFPRERAPPSRIFEWDLPMLCSFFQYRHVSLLKKFFPNCSAWEVNIKWSYATCRDRNRQSFVECGKLRDCDIS